MVLSPLCILKYLQSFKSPWMCKPYSRPVKAELLGGGIGAASLGSCINDDYIQSNWNSWSNPFDYWCQFKTGHFYVHLIPKGCHSFGYYIFLLYPCSDWSISSLSPLSMFLGMACFGWGTMILLTVWQGELTHKQQLTRLIICDFCQNSHRCWMWL